MEDNRKPIIMTELVDGRDYLVNYYLLFGVGSESLANADKATAEGILKSAYRQLNLQYHPDRYAHLAPAFQAQVAQVYSSVVRGYGILTDPAERAAYDMQLSEWKGPVSNSGHPICDWNFLVDINRKPLTDEQIVEAKRLLPDFIGYNPSTHQLLERLVKDDKKSDPELAQALDCSLRGREIFIMIEEKLRWEQAGIPNRQLPEEAPVGYLEQVQGDIEEIRAAVPERASRFFLQAQFGQLRFPVPEGDCQTQQNLTEPAKEVSKISEALLRALEDAAPKLEALARQREEVFQQRIKLSVQYQPKQKKLRPNLVVRVSSPEREMWFAFRLKGDQINADSAIGSKLPALADITQARIWIRKGWSILVMVPREGLNVHDQLRAVVEKHFEDYLDQEKPAEA